MPFDLPRFQLSAATREALAEARDTPTSYQLRCLYAPESERLLVVLGEAHLKLAAAHRLGERIVPGFSLRGVETFPRTAFLGRLLRLLIHGPRLALMLLSLGLVKGSTITTAFEQPDGTTVKLESEDDVPLSLHVASAHLTLVFLLLFGSLLTTLLGVPSPVLGAATLAVEIHLLLTLLPAYALRAHAFHWWLNPTVAILTTRDRTMADGTMRLLRDHPTPREAVVVMGRAHLRGYCQQLIDHQGFVAIDPVLLGIGRA